jgi:hypothetical protein
MAEGASGNATDTKGRTRQRMAGRLETRSARDMEAAVMKVFIAEDNRLMLEDFRRALERVDDIEIVGLTHSAEHVLALVERAATGSHRP